MREALVMAVVVLRDIVGVLAYGGVGSRDTLALERPCLARGFEVCVANA